MTDRVDGEEKQEDGEELSNKTIDEKETSERERDGE